MSGHANAFDANKPMNNLMTEQDACPICGSTLIEKVIDYNDWSNDHLMVIRSVPVHECQEQGHRFFSASVARRLETLFDSENEAQLRPIEIMKVPVVEFALA